MSVTIRFGTPTPQWAPLDVRIRSAIRACLAEEIERLLDMVDALDGDPELEETGDDEPYLGWLGAPHGRFDAYPLRDLEEDAGDEGEPDEDREPALGWTLEGWHGRGGIWGEDEESDNGLADGGALSLFMQDALAERQAREGREQS